MAHPKGWFNRLSRHIDGALMVLPNRPHGRDARRVWPGLRPPRVRSTGRLLAMKERLLGLDDDREARQLVLGRESHEKFRVVGDPGRAIDPQRILVAGDEVAIR